MKVRNLFLALAAMAVAVILTGCPTPLRPDVPPPVQMVEIFNLADHLATLRVGETDPDVIFDGIPLTGGGGIPSNLSIEVVSHNGSNALEVSVVQQWAGIDLVHRDFRDPPVLEEFNFQVGDIIAIEGTNAANFMIFNLDHQGWSTLQDWEGNDYAPGQEFEHEFNPLSAVDVVAIGADAAAAGPGNNLRTIRIRGNQTDSSFIIANLTVQRNLAAPTVTVGAQTGSVVRGSAGSVTFPVSASFLTGADGSINLADAGVVRMLDEDGVPVALPTGVTATGNIAIANGASTGTPTLTLALTAAASQALGVGPHQFMVTLRGTESMPGNLFVSGLVVPETVVVADGATYTPIDVRAFRLPVDGASSIPLDLEYGVQDGITAILNPGSFVLDANGSGTARVVIRGSFTNPPGLIALTVTAPGTGASETIDVMSPLDDVSVTITLGMENRVGGEGAPTVADVPGGGLRITSTAVPPATGVVDFSFANPAFPTAWRLFENVTLVFAEVTNNATDPIILSIGSGFNPGARQFAHPEIDEGDTYVTFPMSQFHNFGGAGYGLTLLTNQQGNVPPRSTNFSLILSAVVFHSGDFEADDNDNDNDNDNGDITEGMTSVMRGTDGLPHFVNASGNPTVDNTATGIVVTDIGSGHYGITLTSQAGGGTAPATWTAGQRFVVRGTVDSISGSGTVDMVLQGTAGGFGIVATDAGLAEGDSFELAVEITSTNVTAITTDGNLTIRGSGNGLVSGGFTITGIWISLP